MIGRRRTGVLHTCRFSGKKQPVKSEIGPAETQPNERRWLTRRSSLIFFQEFNHEPEPLSLQSLGRSCDDRVNCSGRGYRCGRYMRKDTRLAIAQNLVRIYREVLEQPVPDHLLELVARLEAGQDRQR
jgi:hypothetical protein